MGGRGGGTVFYYKRILSNKCRRKRQNRKSSLSKHHSDNCCRQDPPMNAKISGLNLRRKRFAQSQGSSPKTFINYKRKGSNFIAEIPGRHHLSQVIKVNTPK